MSQSVLSEETEIGPTQDVELPTKVYNEEEIMDICGFSLDRVLLNFSWV